MELDLSAAASDTFDAEAFVRNALLPGSENQTQFLRSVQDAKERASSELQKNVFKNYMEFVALSKEIGKLEDDMLVLRNLVHDLKSVATDQTEEELTGVGLGRNTGANVDEQARPNSRVASQLDKKGRKNHYELIENLSRHLPPNEARKCLKESSVSLEGGSATGKASQSLTMILFSDALVVASRKWAAVGSQKMVLEHCWGLTDVAIVDVKDSADLVNAFKVIKHPDFYIYRLASNEEKRSWLVAVKKATNDFLVARRAERAGTAVSTAEGESDQGLVRSPAVSDTKEAAPVRLPTYASAPRETGDPALTPPQWQWLSNLPDELDVWIAHRQYEPATIESRRALDVFKTLPTNRPHLQDLRSRIQSRIDDLTSKIYRDLANPASTRPIARRSIELLCRLNQAERARDAFLQARMAMIQHRIRQLNFDGDISAYISQLSIVFFTLLRNTCEWYNEAFADPAMTSGFLKWVKTQIENFASIFKSQVFESNQPFGVIAESLQAAVEQARTLREVGLDLTFLLEHLFVPSSKDAVLEYIERQKEKILEEIEADDFASFTANDNKGSPDDDEYQWEPLLPKPSASYASFQVAITRFLEEVMLLGTLTLYDTIVKSFATLMSTFVEGVEAKVSARTMSDAQTLRAIADGINAADVLIPVANEQLSMLFDRPIIELEDLRSQLLGSLRQMISDFCDWTGQKLLSDSHYPFPTVDYSSNNSIQDNAKPSVPITKFVVTLHSIAVSTVTPIDRHDVISRCIENAMVSMTQIGWETPRGPRTFGFGGVQQLVLDIHFVLRVCESYITDKTNDAANDVCEKALRTYFLQKKDGPNRTLKSGEWYDKRIDDVLAASESEFAGF